MSLRNKTIIVTGANGALGRAVAKEAIALGAIVHALDIAFVGFDLENANLKKHEVNLLDANSASACIKNIGKVDALCNVAGGFTMGHAVFETQQDEFKQMYDINVQTMLNCIYQVVPQMTAQAYGSIVNVGAKSALGGAALQGAYIAAKSTVLRLTECMADELKINGIRVNAVLPTIIDTPANRAAMPNADSTLWVQPTQLAKIILFLASDDSNGINGALLPVRGLL